MLPQKNRLKKRKDFNLTFEKGDSYHNILMEIRVRRTENGKKFAFVAPVKYFKKATKRNKVKRILREALRINLDRVVEGIDIIFIAKKNILEYSFEEVKRSIIKSLNKFKLLKNDR